MDNKEKENFIINDLWLTTAIYKLIPKLNQEDIPMI